MSLAEALAAEDAARPVRGCGVCTWRDTLDEANRATFDTAVEAVNTGRISRAVLYRACQSEGLAAAKTTFGEHFTRCMR